MINNYTNHISQMEKMRWVDNCGSEQYFYVWDDCRGECISTLIATSSFNVHDIFGYYGPSIMHKPLILNEKPDILVIEFVSDFNF